MTGTGRRRHFSCVLHRLLRKCLLSTAELALAGQSRESQEHSTARVQGSPMSMPHECRPLTLQSEGTCPFFMGDVQWCHLYSYHPQTLSTTSTTPKDLLLWTACHLWLLKLALCAGKLFNYILAANALKPQSYNWGPPITFGAWDTCLR